MAQLVEQILDRPLEQLQDDVPGEAVRDDDVGRAAQELTALQVAVEVQLARAEERVRLERERVALLVLLADREQAHVADSGCRAARWLKIAPMCANWSRCSGRASAFAPASSSTDGPCVAGIGDGDRRPHHARDPAQVQQPGGEHRAGVAGRDDRVGIARRPPREPRRRGSSPASPARPRPASRPSRSGRASRRAAGPACRARPGRRGRLRSRRPQRRARRGSPRPVRLSPPSASTATRVTCAREPGGGGVRPRGPYRFRRSGRHGGRASASRTGGTCSRAAPRSRASRGAGRGVLSTFSSSGLP